MFFLTTGFNERSSIIMCPPLHVAVKTSGHANQKERLFGNEYAADPVAFTTKAMQQWNGLVLIYESLSADVFKTAPLPGMGDQLYTADPAFTLINQSGDILLLQSRFTNASRQGEVDAFVATVRAIVGTPGNYLSGRKLTIREASNPVEGTGDAYYDPFRDLIFAGYIKNPDPANPGSGRSSINAHAEMEYLTDVEVVSLEVVEPCFHIDICLCPLPSGHMLIYKDGMTQAAYDELILKAFIDKGLDPAEYAIHVSENDAINNYVTNLVYIRDTIVMPQFGEDVPPIDPALLERLRGIGYKVIVHEVGQLIKAGGANHCASHVLMERVPGGYLALQRAVASTKAGTAIRKSLSL